MVYTCLSSLHKSVVYTRFTQNAVVYKTQWFTRLSGFTRLSALRHSVLYTTQCFAQLSDLHDSVFCTTQWLHNSKNLHNSVLHTTQ